MAEYPYQPLEDSFFGNLIGEVLESQGISKEELLKSIYSNLNIRFPYKDHFVGTPKAEKQITMSILPEKIRKWILDENFQRVNEEFQILAFGDKEYTRPKIDIALEILEWIYTGFDQEKLVLELIKILTGSKIPLDPEFLTRLRSAYENAFQDVK